MKTIKTTTAYKLLWILGIIATVISIYLSKQLIPLLNLLTLAITTLFTNFKEGEILHGHKNTNIIQ